MFTGIVEELGTVAEITDQGDAIRLTIAATDVLDGVRLGDSIAVNGCCLTAAALEPTGTWTADVMAETLAKTSLAGVAPGDVVNLERAMSAGGRLGGHLVQGHIDGTGTVVRRQPSEHWELVTVEVPEGLERYIVDKGSIALDGVSLTVVSITGREVTVSLIPETLARTTLGRKQPGELVNVETDIIARHVEKLLAR
ncbi:riboflavin synthase [Nocardioides sp.]|uniref:riboflavin synthase n=1 Tax=Nocardioides sp. TaxID=35761 RepID=UPI0026165623|nr:riboflavin synthase [Nocardioides sp.]